jgi:hypothetical protein
LFKVWTANPIGLALVLQIEYPIFMVHLEFQFESLSRRVLSSVVGLALSLLGFGCFAPGVGNTPTAAGLKPIELIDPTAYGGEGPPPPVFQQLYELGERVRESQKPDVIPPPHAILILSGGGGFGAYSAGVLCGWTEAGNRPQFDVVTGVSTGALIAVFAFLGSDFDAELKRSYTQSRTADIFRRKTLPWSLLSDSLNDNRPLLRQIEAVLTPEVVARIAAAHQQGRRLYIGTTDLDGRRPVVWDLGGIAASDRSDRRELLCKLLLASAAIPGFFPAVEIPVVVDGKKYIERHVDGGITQPLFFRPPYIAQDKRCASFPELFYGSDEYVIVAGKIYADPQPVQPQVLNIVSSSVSTFLYAQTRDSLVKLYMQSLLTGMKYHLAAIPNDYPAAMSATEFDPVEMTRLFEEGRRQASAKTVWRTMPPGVGGREELLQRAGTTLTVVPYAGPTTPAAKEQVGWPTSQQGLPVTNAPSGK